MDPGNRLGLFRRVFHRLGLHPDEGRGDADATDLEAALEGRIDAAQRDGLFLASHAARCLDRAAGGAVPDIEDVLLAAVEKVAIAQQLAVVLAHQQRQVGLLLDEGLVDQALAQHHLDH